MIYFFFKVRITCIKSVRLLVNYLMDFFKQVINMNDEESFAVSISFFFFFFLVQGCAVSIVCNLLFCTIP